MHLLQRLDICTPARPVLGHLHPDEDDHIAQEGEEGAEDAGEAPELQGRHTCITFQLRHPALYPGNKHRELVSESPELQSLTPHKYNFKFQSKTEAMLSRLIQSMVGISNCLHFLVISAPIDRKSKYKSK